ncbi:MAG: sigma-54-dependent Fis family transcriptional regulator [Candidatus Aminicenantes bacterium]|nr:sigma-54-dependent Fis family transcriptional regulator [Candidatus Aminicenantes bacterium]
MIESIKNKVWDVLKGKEVSLAMLYDREGRILWHRGRRIEGQRIEDGRGFSKSCAVAALRQGRASEDGVAVTRSVGDLPESARLLYVKNVMVVPAGDSLFLYVDGGVKEGFSLADAALIGAMGAMLGETIDRFRSGGGPTGNIAGDSAAARQVRELVAMYALEEEPVLLLGETGVGKNHVADLIHRLSGRPGDLVVVHTPNIPADLFENELFGHARGAFTHAEERKKGLIEEADKGTVFLDEIAEIPLALQSKLLRFIESGRFRVLGSVEEVRVEARVIAASNRDLAEEVKGGRFRKDLFFRLNVLPLPIPPLRERREDIRALVRENERLLRGKKLGAGDWKSLEEHPWPGNVRELLHVLTRAGIVLTGPLIEGEIGRLLGGALEVEHAGDNAALAGFQAAIDSGKSFWETVWSAFIRRDLNRGQVRLFLKGVFAGSGHNLKGMAAKLNIREGEYPRFVSMLHRYSIHPRKDG